VGICARGRKRLNTGGHSVTREVWELALADAAFSPGVKVLSNHVKENFPPVDSRVLYSIANRKLVV
jgi:hypothetical protein